MKILLVGLSMVIAQSSFAKSTIVGTFIDGGKTLSIQIVDRPGDPEPHVAGQLWTFMKSKRIRAQSISIACDAVKPEPIGDYFGSCRIRLKADMLRKEQQRLLFGLFGQEAQDVFAHLIDVPVTLHAQDEAGSFIFTSDRLHGGIGIVIDMSLVQD